MFNQMERIRNKKIATDKQTIPWKFLRKIKCLLFLKDFIGFVAIILN